MNHYVSNAYDDMALERMEIIKKEAEMRRLVKESRKSLPKQPGLLMRLRAIGWNVIHALRLPNLRPAHKNARRYAKRTA